MIPSLPLTSMSQSGGRERRGSVRHEGEMRGAVASAVSICYMLASSQVTAHTFSESHSLSLLLTINSHGVLKWRTEEALAGESNSVGSEWGRIPGFGAAMSAGSC